MGTAGSEASIIYKLFRFPGIIRPDKIIDLLSLLSSKDPDNEIATQIILDGGYDPCDTLGKKSKSFWKELEGCGAGFIPDPVNGYCYKLIPEMKLNLDEGEKYCEMNYDADLILFYSNAEVDGFLNIFKSGTFSYILLRLKLLFCD